MRQGFTLIELSFSVAFIALLSIVISTVTLSLIASYERSMTVSQINTTGMDLVNDFRSSLSGTTAKSVSSLCSTIYKDESSRSRCVNDIASNFTAITFSGYVTIGNRTENAKQVGNTMPEPTPIYGAVCTGTYSYLWNSGYIIEPSLYTVRRNVNSASNIVPKLTFAYYYLENNDSNNGTRSYQEADNIRLLKVRDPSRSVCVAINENSYTTSAATELHNSRIDLTKGNFGYITEQPVELLTGDLAIYDLNLYSSSQNDRTSNIFYTGNFILATIRGGINVRAHENYCSVPTEYSIQDYNYCAINKFDFATQAIGE